MKYTCEISFFQAARFYKMYVCMRKIILSLLAKVREKILISRELTISNIEILISRYCISRNI